MGFSGSPMTKSPLELTCDSPKSMYDLAFTSKSYKIEMNRENVEQINTRLVLEIPVGNTGSDRIWKFE